MSASHAAKAAGSRANHSSGEYEDCYPSCPDEPAGEDFAAAWQMACRHVRKRYVLPETIRHRAVVSECYRLACMMVAYGFTADRARVPEGAKPPTPMAKTIQRISPRDHHVIVVDDVADVLVSVGAFLVNAGFTVKKAADGDEALQVIASDPSIDVLVTDFAMPGLNGADLIAQATQIRPSLKALVITGYPNADGLDHLPTGTLVLSKPFRRGALVGAVNSLFESESADYSEEKDVVL